MYLAILELFVWLFGLTVGSFLNVVVYRMPLGLSVASPRWSFCPRCRARIRGYDNIPVLSWLLLGGGCRNCRRPISVQYPLIEALTGLAFVLTFHLLFVEPARVGLPLPSVATDWPLLLAWLTLAAALIACSAMDIVSYMLDIRLTELATAVGIALHGMWARPGYFGHHSITGIDGGIVDAPVGAAAVACAAVMLWRLRTVRLVLDQDEHEDTAPSEAPEATEEPTAEVVNRGARGGVRSAGLLGVLLVVVASLVLLGYPLVDRLNSDIAAALVPASLLVIFLVMVLAASQQRDADHEVHEAIDAESADARGVALSELWWLMPMVLAAIGAGLLVGTVDGAAAAWHFVVNWKFSDHWYPVAGMVFSVHGMIVGASIGWVLRLVFTLLFGREAFGTGDIYILGAAGALAGWDIALLGLMLAIGIALLGWILSLLMKSTTMIPFGPPLALGFVVALWLNVPAAQLGRQYAEALRRAWAVQPQLVWTAGGILLVGGAAAVVLARLLRGWLEPQTESERER